MHTPCQCSLCNFYDRRFCPCHYHSSWCLSPILSPLGKSTLHKNDNDVVLESRPLSEEASKQAEMSLLRIEQGLERGLPFLVAFLALLVAILMPLAVSTYIQINTRGKFQSKIPRIYKRSISMQKWPYFFVKVL